MPTWRLRVDLHMHTCYSDGADTPAQLVAKAAQQGLHSIAITDHDILAALPEAQQAGLDYGVEVLAGVEMLERINALLVQHGQAPLDNQRVLHSARGTLTRPHLAHALVARGYATSVQNAFEHFLIPCNVPKAALSPEEAFNLIAQAGGVCSLAHPGTISTDPEVMQPLLATFKAMGLVGLEVYHHRHYPDAIEFFQCCATRYGLVATGGSDYHGRPEGAVLGYIAPGYAIPHHVLPDLQHAHAAGAQG